MLRNFSKLEKDALIEKFYEFATTKDDTSPMEVINPQYYTKALKKKLTHFLTKRGYPTDSSIDDYLPNNIENNAPSILASDIIIRLNGIRDEKYAIKIAYETFRTIGRVYERKYQKDVNDSMDILTPLLNITDGVFTEISKNVKIMNKSVKMAFFMPIEKQRIRIS